MLFSPVEVDTLGRTDAPPKESYQMFKEFIFSELILNVGKVEGKAELCVCYYVSKPVIKPQDM
jgi:hypothetical protein